MQQPPLDWQSFRDEMVARITIDEAGVAKLTAILETEAARWDAWNQSKRAAWNRAEQQMFEAARQRDLAGLRAAKVDAERFRDEANRLQAEIESSVLGVLTPAQRLAWDGALLADRIRQLGSSIVWSQEQEDRLREESLSVAQWAAEQPNPGAAGLLELENRVLTSILAPPQQEIYRAVQKANPMRSLATPSPLAGLWNQKAGRENGRAIPGGERESPSPLGN